MKKTLHFTVLLSLIGIITHTVSLADNYNCSDAHKTITQAITRPPATGTEEPIAHALAQCPNSPQLFLRVGDYYNQWSRKAALAKDQARFNYLATEYYAKGIKAGKGDEVKQLRYRLAALESDTSEITPAGIRSIQPGTRLNIRVMFAFNSAELTSGAQEKLDVLGNYLQNDHSSRIVLEGHTDMAGAEAYNARLSFQRAESAKQYLVENYSITPEMIETHGYGFDRLADVDDPLSQKNRRVRVRKLPASEY